MSFLSDTFERLGSVADKTGTLKDVFAPSIVKQAPSGSGEASTGGGDSFWSGVGDIFRSTSKQALGVGSQIGVGYLQGEKDRQERRQIERAASTRERADVGDYAGPLLFAGAVMGGLVLLFKVLK